MVPVVEVEVEVVAVVSFICVQAIISVYNDQHYDQHVTAAQIYGSRCGQRYIETGSLYKLFFDGNT